MRAERPHTWTKTNLYYGAWLQTWKKTKIFHENLILVGVFFPVYKLWGVVLAEENPANFLPGYENNNVIVPCQVLSYLVQHIWQRKTCGIARTIECQNILDKSQAEITSLRCSKLCGAIISISSMQISDTWGQAQIRLNPISQGGGTMGSE